MKIVVLGATGTIGTYITRDLIEAGHDVVQASRHSGVDAVTGAGLDAALTDAEVVIDCLNVGTTKAKTAVVFFAKTARNIIAAARRTGVGHIICVNIAGVSDPGVSDGYGYYKGKAVQAKTYRESRLPVTLIHSTQWFELIDFVVEKASFGPITMLPTMRMAPVAAESVARLVAAQAVAEPPEGTRDVTIRGPEVATGLELAQIIRSVRGSVGGRNPKFMLQLPIFGQAIATDGLIPSEGIIDDVTLHDWLRQTSEETR